MPRIDHRTVSTACRRDFCCDSRPAPRQRPCDGSQKMRDWFEAAWMQDDHRARLRRRQYESDRSDGRCEALLDMQVLKGYGGDGPASSESPLAQSVWGDYQAASDGLAESFPALPQSLPARSLTLASGPSSSIRLRRRDRREPAIRSRSRAGPGESRGYALDEGDPFRI
jgi:hypothetical protein